MLSQNAGAVEIGFFLKALPSSQVGEVGSGECESITNVDENS